MDFVFKNNNHIIALASEQLSKLEGNTKINGSEEEFGEWSDLVSKAEVSFLIFHSFPTFFTYSFFLGYHLS